MYQAKNAGRNTVCFFDSLMQVEQTNHVVFEEDMRKAVVDKQFRLHYQAQVKNKSEVTGVEALLRWQHPTRGWVSPAEFIPTAEKTGVILPLGLWVLETACTQLARWADRAATANLTMAVNVTARQFKQGDFVEQVIAVLERTGANPRQIRIELTESVLITDVESVITKMNLLKAKGISFSLDDFGTGYSSLSYLKRLPLSQLKIAQEFMRDKLIDPDDMGIARMVIALADSMGLTVMAEGVETEAQRDFLAMLGCTRYQGFLFCTPLPIEEFEAFIKGT
jgi:EAL domain-containing protein (putative c-di-GMP-specific phosphodiesterase class I)